MTARQRKRNVTPEVSTEKFGTVIGPGEVRFERILPGPIERWSNFAKLEVEYENRIAKDVAVKESEQNS